MADVTVTTAQVRAIEPENSTLLNCIAGGTITEGQAVYMSTSTGKVLAADGSAASTAQVVGIALNAASSGQAVAVIKEGKVAGFTLSGSYWDPIYLSNTDSGVLGTTAGAVSVVVGRVWSVNDGSGTKVLYVSCNYLSTYS